MNHLGDTNKMVGEDHIRDATKMVSDTPRTDRVLKNCNGWHHVPIELARELERELNAANQRIKRLEQSAQEIDKEWFQVIESILGFHPVSMTEALRIGIERIKKQRQRIKRLEEAGDKIVESGWSVQDWSGMCVVWAKAKEDKL